MFTKSPDLSEDVTQDVFAKIWAKRQNLFNVDKLEGYLFITARNLIFDQMRKKVFTVGNDGYLKEYFSDPDAILQRKFQIKFMNCT
jgi:RNA polymerase sigma-70 factor (ECF subfamily)